MFITFVLRNPDDWYDTGIDKVLVLNEVLEKEVGRDRMYTPQDFGIIEESDWQNHFFGDVPILDVLGKVVFIAPTSPEVCTFLSFALSHPFFGPLFYIDNRGGRRYMGPFSPFLPVMSTQRNEPFASPLPVLPSN